MFIVYMCLTFILILYFLNANILSFTINNICKSFFFFFLHSPFWLLLLILLFVIFFWLPCWTQRSWLFDYCCTSISSCLQPPLFILILHKFMKLTLEREKKFYKLSKSRFGDLVLDLDMLSGIFWCVFIHRSFFFEVWEMNRLRIPNMLYKYVNLLFHRKLRCLFEYQLFVF